MRKNPLEKIQPENQQTGLRKFEGVKRKVPDVEERRRNLSSLLFQRGNEKCSILSSSVRM
jgi:hypothetical protein